MVYQMDVKSAFLYGKIEEEVFVCQPLGIKDPDILDRVYKVEKALYGLHQAPRESYETLSTYLLYNGFQIGMIDKTLFIKMDKNDILLVQKEDGIFISQDKYMNEILNMFGYSDVKTVSTPMETHKTLLKNKKGEDVNEHLYRSMIGSLMYLTSLRPDIMFAKKQKPRKPRRQDTQETQPSDPTTNVEDEALNKDNVPIHSNDLPLLRFNTLVSGEDRLKLKELMEIYTNLQQRVIDLENTKTTQAKEILSLKRRVKRLEKKQRSRTYGLKRLYKVGAMVTFGTHSHKKHMGSLPQRRNTKRREKEPRI
nr:hypothetical protein [Tanacetum cinerariifolium]